jgi:hypothetical protein
MTSRKSGWVHDVIVIEPGGVKTEWSSIMLDNMKENSGSGPYRAIVDAWVKASSTEVGAANPADIANLISRAVTSSRPKPRYVAPAHARIFLFLCWILSDRAFDRLWAKFFRVLAATRRPRSDSAIGYPFSRARSVTSSGFVFRCRSMISSASCLMSFKLSSSVWVMPNA